MKKNKTLESGKKVGKYILGALVVLFVLNIIVKKYRRSTYVSVGKFSYGVDKVSVMRYHKNDGKLIVGNFCSFASSGVTIFLGNGQHDPNNISTYPFNHTGLARFAFRIKIDEDSEPSYSKGDVIINNDVWIGRNATIMSGVTIGNGAVIAANSVVTKDVLAYSIVAGNPARVVKMRFTEDQIKKIEELKWWDWSPFKISKMGKHLCKGIETIDRLKDHVETNRI